jgi:hypothetical protein
VIPSRCTRRVSSSMTKNTEPGEAHRAVDVEEISGQQCLCVGAQEGTPGIITRRGWRDPVRAQNLTDGGSRNLVPEPTQLALDPHHSPPSVLPRQAQDQRDELVRDRRSSRRPRLAPLLHDHPLVPCATAVTFPASRFGTRTAFLAGDGQGPRAQPAQATSFSPSGCHGAGSPPHAVAQVSPRPWTPKSGRAAPSRTAPWPAAGKSGRRARTPIMAAIKPQVKRMAEYSTSATRAKAVPSANHISPGPQYSSAQNRCCSGPVPAAARRPQPYGEVHARTFGSAQTLVTGAQVPWTPSRSVPDRTAVPFR